MRKSPTPKAIEGRHHGRYVGLERQENACRFWVGPPRSDTAKRFKTLALNVEASYKILLLRLWR